MCFIVQVRAEESAQTVGLQSGDGSPILAIRASEDAEIGPHSRALIKSGIHVALPRGFAGFAVPSDMLVRDRGVTFANAPGLIDTGYRGEVCGIAFNTDAARPARIARGEHFMDLYVRKTLRGDAAAPQEGKDMANPILTVRMLAEDLEAPSYAHDDDNGLDLRASESVVLAPFERRAIPLGVGIGIEGPYIAQLQPRSGLSLKKGLSLVGSPRLIVDPEPSTMLEAVFVNLDPSEPIAIERGERVAQLVITERADVEVRLVGELDETGRGTGGFGSSGSS